jgi:nitrate/nitrite transporter NarK
MTTTEKTGDLVRQLSEQVSTLVRDELALARLELVEKGKRAGIGVGLFGGAGMFAWYGFGALIATAILALALAMPAWLAALIVAVVLFAVAGVLALLGKKEVSQATPPMPTEAVASTKADVQTIKAAVEEGRHA